MFPITARSIGVTVLTFVSLMALNGPAGAQVQSAASATRDAASQSDESNVELGEIIVSARKRQETILDVPIVETAITQSQLENKQTMDLKDVSTLVPGLSLAQTLGASGTQVSLRGVGTSASNAGIDSSVALNIDGLQLTQGIAYSSAVFDLAQVEVLKGPQALFYGKNSPGGVISLRTADPTDKFELITSYGHEFEAGENREQLIVSGPVSSTLRLRLAAQYDSQDGYFTNDAVAAPGLGGLDPQDRSAPHDRAYVIRGTAIWLPTEQFDAHLKLDFTNDRQLGGVGLQLNSCPDGTAGVPPGNIPFLGGATCQRGKTLQVVDLNPNAFKGLLDDSGDLFNETNQGYGSLELNYRPQSDITLTSVTGYYHLYFQSQQNGTASTDAGPGLASIVDPIRRQDITEELRANSDFSGPLNFTAGGFYQNGRLLNSISLPGNTALNLPVSLGDYQEFVEIQSISGFGQARWLILPTLELDAGARFTHEARDLTATNYISGKAVPFPTAVPRISSNDTSPEATVSYRPTDDLTTFASYKTGFKSGSFSLTSLSGTLPNLSVGDEKVKGAEFGAKTRMLDRRLFMDVAFYDYRYTGLQVGVNQPAAVGAAPVLQTLNAGDSLVYGVDFDINYLPPQVDGLRLQASVERNQARFETLNNVPCWGGQTIAAGCNQALNRLTGRYTGQDLAGQPLVRAPDWQANFGFDYERPIGRDLTLGFSSANQYSSRYLTILGLRPDFYQSSFFKSDISVRLKGPNDRWEFAVVGKNIGNVLTSGGCTTFDAQNGVVLGGEVTGGTTRGPAGIDEVGCYLDPGREVWLRATLRLFN